MASSSTSYLQTLANDEAVAFLTSLQKVKDHLSEELQWMSQLVKQKTVQLQGIETLLAEAQATGSAKLNSSAVQAFNTQLLPTTEAATVTLLDEIALTQETIDEDDFPEDDSIDADAITAAPPKKTKQPKSPSSKSKTKSATSKRSSTAKKPKSASKPKAAKRSGTGVDLRELLQPTFQDKTFGDVVSEILEQADQPLHLDDLIDKMYTDLTDDDYKRAKVSLANVLSVGSSKGRWQNVSKGMYASNAVAAS